MEKNEMMIKIFNECHNQIYQQALRVVKNIHDAEDIRSNVYIKIQWLECANFNKNKKTSLSSWVYTITNHVILDFFRTNHQNRYKAVSDFADGDDEQKSYFTFVAPNRYNTDTKVLKTETRNQIAKAFRTLKPKYRKIAGLYFLKDLPYVEIADIVNVPMGTVKGMLSRSRVKLQKELKGIYVFKNVKTEMSKV